MNIYEILNTLREDPMFVLSNHKSLREVRSFLAGYEYASLAYGEKEGLFGQLRLNLIPGLQNGWVFRNQQADGAP